MKIRPRLFLSAAMIGLASLAAGEARADAAPVASGTAVGANDELGEVVVTAQKRSENLQTAPAAITAVTGDNLVTQGVVDTNGLEILIPSANFKQSASASMLFVRGVGNSVSAPAVDPGVSFNVNGVYVPREGTGSNGILYDVARVEVLPGPQGTLWGRNSAGGAIDVITNEPTDTFGGNALLEVGNYSSVHASGAINIPVMDKLQVRGAFNILDHDGYVSNGANDADSKAGRLTVAVEPIDDLKILAYGAYSHDGGIGSFGVNGPPVDPNNPWYTQLSAKGLYNDITNWTTNGQVDYHFDGLALTYIPSFDYVNVNTLLGTNGARIAGQEKEHQISQELRLANDDTGPLKWVVGLYDYNFYLHFNQFFNGSPILLLAHQRELSTAGFGQATYSVTDRIRVTVGGRYSWDQKEAYGAAPNAKHVFTAFEADQDTGHADFKVGGEMDVREHSMVYATVQTGYVPGAYSNVPNSSSFSNIIEPEKLISYTAGIKNRFFDNRLEINDEVFYYNYKNFQVTARNGTIGVTTVQSAAKVGIYGDQLDVKFKVTPVDILHASIGYLHSRYDDFSVLGVNYSGQQTVDSPDVTANLGYEHTFDFADGSFILASVESHLETGHWTNFQHSPGLHQAGFSKTNLQANYNPPDGSWSLGAYINNVENAAVQANGSAGGVPGPSSFFIEPPRTFGVRGTFNF